MKSKTSLGLLPYAFAKKQGLLFDPNEENAVLYHLKEPSLQALGEAARFLQSNLEPKAITEERFQKRLAELYQSNTSVQDAAVDIQEDLDLSWCQQQLANNEDLLDNQDDAPIIRLLNALFTQAIKQKASDIHIETYESRVVVRLRVDGVLREILEIQRAAAPLVISRVKVMAKLDIAEKRIPQDGRIVLFVGGHQIDVRVSTLPSNHGERLVLRLLDKQSAQLNLSLLGMPTKHLGPLQTLIKAPHGIILVTGPTGSGKTTSLYAMLTELNEVSRNILTIEDPIEYDLPGIGQTQVNPKVNMTFSKGLRALLRQDPDVIMIGEIRDLETAEIAIQASLTGHLVLSTLHTNSALGALTRLRDMGVESFLLSSSVLALMSQRLVRKLCSFCKEPQVLSQAALAQFQSILIDDSPQTIYQPKGCEACNNLGYSGRTGIYELIIIDETLRRMIHRNENLQNIKECLPKNHRSLFEDGLERVLQGETSLAEILRVTSQTA